jgi:NADPH:quinone reductase-like Zn-dependent oxidoreductase
MPLPQTFKAMVVSETADQKFIREIKPRELSDLPAGELLIEVKYSSLNYKEFPPTRGKCTREAAPRSRRGVGMVL